MAKKTQTVIVEHPKNGEKHRIELPADHDGSRVKVEFPDGETTYTEGFDPAERALAGERPIVPCGNCGQEQALVASEFDCSACGAHNAIAVKVAGDSGAGQSRQSS